MSNASSKFSIEFTEENLIVLKDGKYTVAIISQGNWDTQGSEVKYPFLYDDGQLDKAMEFSEDMTYIKGYILSQKTPFCCKSLAMAVAYIDANA